MKQNRVKKLMAAMAGTVLAAGLLAGCANSGQAETGNTGATAQESFETERAQGEEGADAVRAGNNVTELSVRFGDDGEAFVMHLENNDTASAIAGYVGTSDWRLPIYDRDDDVDYSVMEYYDIPSRYEIPADPETVTEAKAGDVFYSDPNRIVLFYRDAEISEEYVKIGTFDATEEFVSAVENNPVLEGWGNKIIQIARP